MAINYQQTSAAAWESIVPVSAELDRAICQALAAAGKDGLTDWEIEQQINRGHQSVSANRRHLVEREIVRPTRLRGVTQSGRKAIKWVLAAFYDRALHEDESVAVDGAKMQRQLW